MPIHVLYFLLTAHQTMLFMALRFEAYLRNFDALPALAISVLMDVVDYVRVRYATYQSLPAVLSV